MIERDNRVTDIERNAVEKYTVRGPGVELGCGCSRFSDNVTAIDIHPEPGDPNGPDMIGDVRLMDSPDARKLGSFGFQDAIGEAGLRFIISCHVLEDFTEEVMMGVLSEWWRKLRAGGHIVLVLPDMETELEDGSTPYPRCEEKKPNGDAAGNPSHRVNMGPKFMRALVADALPDAKVVQCATIDRHKSCSFDFVVQKEKDDG